MKTIVNFIFRQFPIVKQLDGYKTILAAVFILLSAVLGALPDVIALLPGYEALGQAQQVIEYVLKYLQQLLEMLGYSFAGAGLLGKWAKK